MTRPVADPYDMSAAAVLPERASAWTASAQRALLLMHDVPLDLERDVEPMTTLAHNLDQLRATCHELGVPVARSAVRFDGGPGPGEHWLADLAGDHFTRLRDVLDSFGRDQLLVTGIRAHAACLMSAAGPALAGVQVFCVADAVVDRCLDDHRKAVRAAADHGATPVTTGQVIGQLLGVLL
ncbi:isochorismatase family protein [Actinokineospora pegani]|uniref:isochorismatase family protein n=1 Tax=Actinokineospora pegani TaxID=2654637 RepID=UPI0012EA68D4|nr:isochorismatase family protein [Actinokineospora pegani]